MVSSPITAPTSATAAISSSSGSTPAGQAVSRTPSRAVPLTNGVHERVPVRLGDDVRAHVAVRRTGGRPVDGDRRWLRSAVRVQGDQDDLVVVDDVDDRALAAQLATGGHGETGQVVGAGEVRGPYEQANGGEGALVVTRHCGLRMGRRQCGPTGAAPLPVISSSAAASPLGGASSLELVAQPAYGQQVLRGRRVGLDLRPQPLDVDVEGLGVADVVAAPDPVDQLAAGEHPAGVAQQELEQLELLQRHRDAGAVDGHDVPVDVHPHRAGLEAAGAAGSLSPRRRSTARIRATSSRAENGLVT